MNTVAAEWMYAAWMLALIVVAVTCSVEFWNYVWAKWGG